MFSHLYHDVLQLVIWVRYVWSWDDQQPSLFIKLIQKSRGRLHIRFYLHRCKGKNHILQSYPLFIYMCTFILNLCLVLNHNLILNQKCLLDFWASAKTGGLTCVTSKEKKNLTEKSEGKKFSKSFNCQIMLLVLQPFFYNRWCSVVYATGY